MNRRELLETLKKIILDIYLNDEELYKIPEEYSDIVFSRKEHKIMLPQEVLDKIDFSNVSFAGINVSHMDFSNLHNVYINPQEVYKKSLVRCNFKNVTFTKEFFGCDTSFSDFTGSKNAIINPQYMYDQFSLFYSKVNSVKFTGSFDDILVSGIDFTGSIGACINPDTVLDHEFKDTVLTDVKLLEKFSDDCSLSGCYYVLDDKKHYVKDEKHLKKMILR